MMNSTVALGDDDASINLVGQRFKFFGLIGVKFGKHEVFQSTEI